MIRIGTISIDDPITIANLFDLPKIAVLDQQLCGYIALEVDYLIVTARRSSRSRPTEAGPKPRIVSAPTMLKGVAPVGALPTLRADVGEAIDSAMAALNLGFSTGSAGNRPASDTSEKSQSQISNCKSPEKQRRGEISPS